MSMWYFVFWEENDEMCNGFDKFSSLESAVQFINENPARKYKVILGKEYEVVLNIKEVSLIDKK